MTLLDHVVLQVDDLNAIGDWYDQVVSLAGGARTFDTPTLIGYALPGQPTQLFFSLATDPGGRQTHLALRVEDETTVRLVHEFATAHGAEILHEPRLWPEYGTGLLRGVHPRPGRKQSRTQVPSLNGTANALDAAHHTGKTLTAHLTQTRRRNTHWCRGRAIPVRGLCGGSGRHTSA